ncbi:Hypothetical protein GSB_154399 [Giardia duodenalis]|uniref:Ankyrin repeat protein 1 n=1 Tax=Giardia intestinalis TaxID=5741 RepID=V6TP84_GIAIN|nr:Hypothetical protein GSB_154399 [Giardia intestinalis]
MLAAERGRCECVGGGSLETGATTRSGTAALMLAVRTRHKPIIELLAPLEGALSGMTALMQAVIERSCTRH